MTLAHACPLTPSNGHGHFGGRPVVQFGMSRPSAATAAGGFVVEHAQ